MDASGQAAMTLKRQSEDPLPSAFTVNESLTVKATNAIAAYLPPTLESPRLNEFTLKRQTSLSPHP